MWPGGAYPQGPGGPTHPPRADLLTFRIGPSLGAPDWAENARCGRGHLRGPPPAGSAAPVPASAAAHPCGA